MRFPSLPHVLLFALLPLPSVAQEAPPEETARTVITSDRLEFISGEEENRFVFSGNVRINATNLFASCDTMEVFTTRDGGDEENPAGIGDISRIEAKGEVVMRQEGREVQAGRATILLREGRLILEDNPVVKDGRGVLTGYRMILHAGEKRVEVQPGPDGQPTRAILPDIRNLGLPGTDDQP